MQPSFLVEMKPIIGIVALQSMLLIGIIVLQGMNFAMLLSLAGEASSASTLAASQAWGRWLRRSGGKQGRRPLLWKIGEEGRKEKRGHMGPTYLVTHTILVSPNQTKNMLVLFFLENGSVVSKTEDRTTIPLHLVFQPK